MSIIEKKIDQMGLDELRNYACARYNQSPEWWKKCKDCKSADLCKTGGRVKEILKEEPEMAKEDIPEKPSGNQRYVSLEAVREKYEMAMKQPDPVGWLYENGYHANRIAAQNGLNAWKRSHGISSERPRSQTFSKTVDKVIPEIFTTGDTITDGIAFLKRMDPKSKVRTHSCKLYTWNKNYPELCAKHPAILALAKKWSARMYGDVTVDEMIDIMQQEDNARAEHYAHQEANDISDESDEIGLDELLQEAGELPEEPQDKLPEEKIEVQAENEVKIDITGNQLQQIREILMKEIAELQEWIAERQEKLKHIDATMQILQDARDKHIL